MELISAALIMIMAITPTQNLESSVTQAVTAYYDSLLSQQVAEWSIQLKKFPSSECDSFEIKEVYGETEGKIPRGSRLCWIKMILDGKERNFPVTLVISPIEWIPVAVADIASRTVITDSLVNWRKLETSDLGSTRIPGKEELYGKWAKVRIPQGAIIDMKRIRDVPAIVVGDDISVVSRIGAVEIKAPGQALEDGRIGEKIRIRNNLNGKRMKGIVESKETVVLK